MKLKSTILAVALIPSLIMAEVFAEKTPLSEWVINEDVDKMTDCVTYILRVDGEPVTITPYVREPPSLVLQIKPAPQGKYFVDVLLRVRVDMFSRHGAAVAVRFDKGKISSSIWSPSQLRDAVFAPKPLDMLAKLRKSKTLAVRYVTSLDNARTTSFDLTNLNDAIKEVKRRVKARKEIPVD